MDVTLQVSEFGVGYGGGNWGRRVEERGLLGMKWWGYVVMGAGST